MHELRLLFRSHDIAGVHYIYMSDEVADLQRPSQPAAGPASQLVPSIVKLGLPICRARSRTYARRIASGFSSPARGRARYAAATRSSPFPSVLPVPPIGVRPDEGWTGRRPGGGTSYSNHCLGHDSQVWHEQDRLPQAQGNWGSHALTSAMALASSCYRERVHRRRPWTY
ncbi:hypothetical protein BD310DRAFT_966689 [Dichomitus squalens]|uniref:Uncharacterized protein n=1 Tax=Dichomitus squalens TaxID=114155 RepID=A0A4Q9PZF7_9APHY|nr:hypothetical protein BD310DRAFT_966689 [Dichomitus squalens]